MWKIINELVMQIIPVNFAMHGTSCTIAHLSYCCSVFLVLIVLSLLYVCLVLLIRSRYLGVQRGVQLIPGGGLRRFLFFELDMRAFLPCYILLFGLLTLPIPLCLVNVTCPIMCYLYIGSHTPIHPSYICCLVLSGQPCES
jgi:hypothetical protein